MFENFEFFLNKLKRAFVFSLFSWASLVVNPDSFASSKLVLLVSL